MDMPRFRRVTLLFRVGCNQKSEWRNIEPILSKMKSPGILRLVMRLNQILAIKTKRQFTPSNLVHTFTGAMLV